MRVVLRVRRKGIIILPKKLRKALGVDKGDEVIAEVVGDRLVLRALKPRLVEESPHEEHSLGKNRYGRMITGGETSS